MLAPNLLQTYGRIDVLACRRPTGWSAILLWKQAGASICQTFFINLMDFKKI
jgi:hypothetical protein